MRGQHCRAALSLLASVKCGRGCVVFFSNLRSGYSELVPQIPALRSRARTASAPAWTRGRGSRICWDGFDDKFKGQMYVITWPAFVLERVRSQVANIASLDRDDDCRRAPSPTTTNGAQVAGWELRPPNQTCSGHARAGYL